MAGILDWIDQNLGTRLGLLVNDPRAAMEQMNRQAGAYNQASLLAVQAERNALRGLPVTPEQAAAKQYVDKSLEDVAGGFAGTTIGKIAKPAQVMSEFVPNVPAGQEMIVMHNISPSKLQYAEQKGGLPVPSLGIGKVSTPYSGFGDITLIAPKEFAVPSAKNPVFRTDAYTKRFPGIDYKFDTKSQKALDDVFASVKQNIPKDAQYNIDRVAENWRDKQYSDAFKYKFLEEKGMLPDKEQFPKEWEFNNQVRATINNLGNEYDNWLVGFEQRLKDVGASPQEKIFKGYTYAGKRRYADATLDNLVKEMKGGAATENWNYGVGNVRAAVSPKFRNLKEVQSSRGLLEDKKSIDIVKDKTDSAYNDLIKRLQEINSSYDPSDAILEIAQTKNMSVLDRAYGGVPDTLKADIRSFLSGFKNMPTEYFEVKPQRAVSLGEFRGALIPKDSTQAVKDILEKQGIKDIYEYATPEEKVALMQKFGKEMFMAAPAGLIAGTNVDIPKKQEKKSMTFKR